LPQDTKSNKNQVLRCAGYALFYLDFFILMVEILPIERGTLNRAWQQALNSSNAVCYLILSPHFIIFAILKASKK
jgi:hypothetical protein